MLKGMQNIFDSFPLNNDNRIQERLHTFLGACFLHGCYDSEGRHRLAVDIQIGDQELCQLSHVVKTLLQQLHRPLQN